MPVGIIEQEVLDVADLAIRRMDMVALDDGNAGEVRISVVEAQT